MEREPQAGFTMLEILIVVVIVAMALTLVAPAIDSGMRSREVRSAVRSIAATMRTLQGDAVRTGTTQTLVFDLTDNVLRIPEREREVGLGDVARMESIQGGQIDPTGIVRVAFYPNGSTSGLTVLVGDREEPSDLGFVVKLDPLIGLVEVQDEER